MRTLTDLARLGWRVLAVFALMRFGLPFWASFIVVFMLGHVMRI